MFSPAKQREVRVRLAPSPTGPMHLGTARTGIFNWLFARKNKGRFIVRIEDTDAERSEKKYEIEILEGLKWLGLDWDEGPDVGGPCGPYRQSERGTRYKTYLQQLLKEKKAYYCYCTKEELEASRASMVAEGLPPKYNGHCRNLASLPKGREPQVIRFKTPEVKVEIKDLIRGKITFDAGLIGDFVIAKNNETALYNFAVVVDDEAMNISHVIRGEDHLSNTPKQILLERALGFAELHFAHLPLILNPDRSKMSKRFADTALAEYRAKGYLPEALFNFLVLLGWHPAGDNELFSRTELLRVFDIGRTQKAGAVFNQEKLDWMNARYIRELDPSELAARLAPYLKTGDEEAGQEFVKKIAAIEGSRIKTLGDIARTAGFFFKLPDYSGSLLVWKDSDAAGAKAALGALERLLGNIPESSFTSVEIGRALTSLLEEKGRGSILWPLRAALSGLAASPDPIHIAEILGKEESLKRIRMAIKKL